MGNSLMALSEALFRRYVSLPVGDSWRRITVLVGPYYDPLNHRTHREI
jgi:hypothetical protein